MTCRKQYLRFMPSGFFALLDDIAALMDDVAVMTKVAGKKTAGILGDDLAVNAEKAVGFASSRELPVLWAITKGSFLNKLVILPAAFALSAFAPWMIEPIPRVGRGIPLLRRRREGRSLRAAFAACPQGGGGAQRGPAHSLRGDGGLHLVRGDCHPGVGSSDGCDAASPNRIRLAHCVACHSRGIRTGRLVGAHGRRRHGLDETPITRGAAFGMLMVAALPWVVKTLGVVGTAALLLVSGGIFHHHLPGVHEAMHAWPSLVTDAVLGLVGGALVMLVVTLVQAAPRGCSKQLRIRHLFPNGCGELRPLRSGCITWAEASLPHGKTHQWHSTSGHRHSRCAQSVEVVSQRIWHRHPHV